MYALGLAYLLDVMHLRFIHVVVGINILFLFIAESNSIAQMNCSCLPSHLLKLSSHCHMYPFTVILHAWLQPALPSSTLFLPYVVHP